MIAKAVLFCLSASTLVSGHSKISVVVGNLGGNGTALGVKGGIIPGAGDNAFTEQDATVFLKNALMSDDMGYTDLGGYNKLSQIPNGMALSGNTLPQVSSTGGSISGTYHVVTTDGAGPISAVLDTTGTGTFSSGVSLSVTTQVPGEGGYYTATKRGLWRRALEAAGLAKRAKNVNLDFPFVLSVPDGTTCSGTTNGLTNLCLVKISNLNKAGPFGGVVPIQIASSTKKRRGGVATVFTA